MSELCLSSTAPKTTQFSILLLSDFILFLTFILSHPLYFSYFIFFSPYFLKLLSFLSPLCVTTSLLLLGFLTVSPGLLHEESPLELPEFRAGFLFSTYHAVTGRLRSSKTENGEPEFHRFEEVIEAYKIVFDSSILLFYENAELKFDENSEFSGHEWCGFGASESGFDELEEKTVEIDWVETTQSIEEEKKLEGLLKDLDEFENAVYNVEEKNVDPQSINSDEVIRVKKEVNPAESKASGDQTRDTAANSRRFQAKLETSGNGGDQYSSKDNRSYEEIRVKKEVTPAESKAAGDQTRDVAANSRRFQANIETSDNGGDQYSSKDNPSYEVIRVKKEVTPAKSKAARDQPRDVAANSRRFQANLETSDNGGDQYSSKDNPSHEVIGVKKEVTPAESKAAGDQPGNVAANSRRFQANIETSDNVADQYSSKNNPSLRTLEWNFWSYGSMRKEKEKEWKRTLACKLFEERQNVNGGEEMDLLWETLEMNSSNNGKPKSGGKKKNKNKKKAQTEYEYKRGGDEEEEEEEEEADMDVQLCCLQALKFSAGKMNLGMGRPNLVKVSKAIKGIGWLHRVTRHGKKGYN
ncbi:hypothetical protein U1Q18_020489 [Sarracenia purpurea var. burkii]